MYISDFKRSLTDKLAKDFFSEPSQVCVHCLKYIANHPVQGRRRAPTFSLSSLCCTPHLAAASTTQICAKIALATSNQLLSHGFSCGLASGSPTGAASLSTALIVPEAIGNRLSCSLRYCASPVLQNVSMRLSNSPALRNAGVRDVRGHWAAQRS